MRYSKLFVLAAAALFFVTGCNEPSTKQVDLPDEDVRAKAQQAMEESQPGMMK